MRLASSGDGISGESRGFDFSDDINVSVSTSSRFTLYVFTRYALGGLSSLLPELPTSEALVGRATSKLLIVHLC
jgi:hypothetical protein